MVNDPCDLGPRVSPELLQDQRQLLADELGARHAALRGRLREQLVHLWLERDRRRLVGQVPWK